MGLEHWAMEEDDGFNFWIWGVAEVVNVSIWALAADKSGTRRGGPGLALGANGDFAVIANAHTGLLAPDVGPPRAGRRGPQHGAFFN